MRLNRAMSVACSGGDGKRTRFHTGRIAGVADFVANEARDRDGVADFAIGGLDEIGNGDGVLANEGCSSKQTSS